MPLDRVLNNHIVATTIHTPPPIVRRFFGLVAGEGNSERTIQLADHDVVIRGARSLGELPLAFVARLLTKDIQAFNVLDKLAEQGEITVRHNKDLGTTDFSCGNLGLLFSRDKTFRTA